MNPNDARVRYVILTSGGKRTLEVGIERAEWLIEEIIPHNKIEKIND